jgi:uncharacterized protein (DUF1778 family)
MTRNTKLLKEDHINVRCTAQQKDAIEKAAKLDGLGASTWLLQLGLRAARESEKAARK